MSAPFNVAAFAAMLSFSIPSPAAAFRRREAARRLFVVLTFLLALSAAAAAAILPASGAGRIRDAEIENLMRDYATPVFLAAGMKADDIDVIIIDDPDINAFVVDNRRIFLNSGLLLDAATPNEAIGVIAHETGHIIGGHIAGLKNALRKTSTAGLLAALAGVAAGAGAAASGNLSAGESASIGSAIISAGNAVSYRSLLAYRRSQESSADRIALRLLEDSGQSGRGMLNFFERLHNRSLARLDGADPYHMTHPTGGRRLDDLEEVTKNATAFNAEDSAELQKRHDRMRAKLAAFLTPPKQTLQRFARQDPPEPDSADAYAYAIALYRDGDLKDALRAIDAMIDAEPDNPYLHELKGQMFFETGKPAKAIPALEKAVALNPDSPLQALALARAMIALETARFDRAALTHLEKAVRLDDQDPFIHHNLGLVYARLGRMGESDLAGAESSLLRERPREAMRYARRARDKLKGRKRLRAEDIIASLEENPPGGARRHRRNRLTAPSPFPLPVPHP